MLELPNATEELLIANVEDHEVVPVADGWEVTLSCEKEVTEAADDGTSNRLAIGVVVPSMTIPFEAAKETMSVPMVIAALGVRVLELTTSIEESST